MSRLTRDGTAETVSRDQILRRKRGQRKAHFPLLSWPCPVGVCSAESADHPGMVTHVAQEYVDQPGKVANPARGQLNMEN